MQGVQVREGRGTSFDVLAVVLCCWCCVCDKCLNETIDEVLDALDRCGHAVEGAQVRVCYVVCVMRRLGCGQGMKCGRFLGSGEWVS